MLEKLLKKYQKKSAKCFKEPEKIRKQLENNQKNQLKNNQL